MRFVEIVVYGVLIVVVLSGKILIHGLPLGNVFYEIGNFLMVLILPRFLARHEVVLSTTYSPVVVEVLLYQLHLLYSSFLSIFLHLCVEGGIYLESVAIKVYVLKTLILVT